MKKIVFLVLLVSLGTLVLESCVSTRKKKEVSKLGKFFQNTTSYYNGYWNAQEIMRLSMLDLRAANNDNFSEILEVEDYVTLDNPKMAKADMDKIIEKVTTVAQLKEASDWVDDCYVMMAKAQYVKQEYETAEETLEYFEEDFNPSNPYGRNFKSKKLRGKAAKRMKEIARKENEKERKEVKKEKEKEKKQKAEVREEVKKEKEKVREEKVESAKDRAKQRQKEAKQRQKERKNKDKTTIKSEETTPQLTKVDLPKPVIKKESSKETVKDKSKELAKENPTEKPKPIEDRSAYPEGKLWLAKTYIKRQNYFGAQSILNRLSEMITNDAVTRELPAVTASLLIKKEEYPEAIVQLKKAIDLADDRQNKARYAFIAGQLSQKLGNYGEAYTFFDQSKDLSRDIKMEFVADLTALKSGILSGKTSKDKIVQQLTRRLTEDKYLEYKDQIYFTIAEIEKSQNNDVAAIDAYRKSAGLSGSMRLKGESYYNVAELYFKNEQYQKSWSYYDSTSTTMVNTDRRYPQVQKYTSNLREIASQIQLINTQDTLIYLASLEGNEQKKAVKNYFIANVKNVAKATQPESKSSALFKSQQKMDISGNSNFFAYNEASKKKGKEDFVKMWGDRPLVDDWNRIAVLTTSSSDNSADVSDPTAETKKSAEEIEQEQLESGEEYKRFLRDLPSNPIKKQEALDKIMNATFTLGKLFRDKIEKYDKSASTLEGMHTRFGETPFELESSYYLYLDYLSMSDGTKAEIYKNKIISKYSDSKYASILRNPEAYAKHNNVNKPDEYYDSAYKLFNAGKYQDAIVSIDKSVIALDDNNPYKAKFALLRSMSLGNTQGKEAYIQGLIALVTTYPNTAEELKAKEILRFLGGDKSAFSALGVRDVDKIYEKSDDAKHYVAIVTYQMKEEDMLNVKIAISEYNKFNFKLERLQLGDGILDIENNSQVILIRAFDNSKKVMDYYNKVILDKLAFLGPQGINVDILPISHINYGKMLNEHNANGYRLFFEKTYLKK